MELSKYSRRLIANGDICFDVGGYDGYFTLVYARLSDAPVWCFESNSDRVREINQNVLLNPKVAAQVSVIETFVADREHVTPRIDSLDGLVAADAVPMPDFLKIDVEGAESAVLSGASKILREARPSLVIETHSEQQGGECVALLHAAGYDHEIVKPRRFLKENRGTGHNEWVIATHPSRVSRAS